VVEEGGLAITRAHEISPRQTWESYVEAAARYYFLYLAGRKEPTRLCWFGGPCSRLTRPGSNRLPPPRHRGSAWFADLCAPFRNFLNPPAGVTPNGGRAIESIALSDTGGG